MKKLIIFVFCMGCGEGWCPEEFGADAYTSGLCVKTNNLSIDLNKIDYVVREVENAVLDIFPDKYFDLERMLSFQPVLLAYWNRVNTYDGPVRGVTLQPRYYYDVELKNGEWIVKYPTLHIKYDYCGNLYYVTGHEILHLVAAWYSNATPEENASHMIDRMFLNWARDNGLSDDLTVESKFKESVLKICKDERVD